MPQAVTHILIPIILVSIIRDFLVKNKRKFPLHYVLIAGLGGILPDLDYITYLLNIQTETHRTLSHTIFVPIIFFILFLVFHSIKIKELGKHKLKLSIIFLMLSIGALTHIILDAFVQGSIIPFYPFSSVSIGFNLINYLPEKLQRIASPSIDAIFLIIWITYLELKHKISDFI
ncbi:MAG: metal-dependent hydrolase [Candidatus Nanoarchaeia archaeon]|nr:metal-dependent hydrolase [Candidatus Nanoarchaeia archaeon]